MKYQYLKKTPIILILSLVFATLPTAKPAVAFAEPEKTKGAIQSEWPEMDFTAAYDSFEKKDFSRAAQEIRKGADFLEAASERSEGKIKKDLLLSYGELDKLSGDIEKGAVNSSARLREAFSRAHQALAEYYHARLKDSWLKRDAEKAGRELQLAVTNLERGIVWAEGGVAKKTGAVLEEARILGERLIHRAAWTTEEVEKEIDAVGAELKGQRDKSTRSETNNKDLR